MIMINQIKIIKLIQISTSLDRMRNLCRRKVLLIVRRKVMMLRIILRRRKGRNKLGQRKACSLNNQKTNRKINLNLKTKANININIKDDLLFYSILSLLMNQIININ